MGRDMPETGCPLQMSVQADQGTVDEHHVGDFDSWSWKELAHDV